MANDGSLTVSDTALPLPNSCLSSSNAVITIETASIRYRLSGGAPTASVGHLVNSGGVITLTNNREIRDFQIIKATATDASIYFTSE